MLLPRKDAAAVRCALFKSFAPILWAVIMAVPPHMAVIAELTIR